MSTPNSITETERVQALPRLPQDKGEPVFAEPWQAQAFALAVKLSEQGYFTWKEWTVALGDELNAARSRVESDDGSHYYDHWLAALEHLVMAKGLADAGHKLRRLISKTPFRVAGRASQTPLTIREPIPGIDLDVKVIRKSASAPKLGRVSHIDGCQPLRARKSLRSEVDRFSEGIAERKTRGNMNDLNASTPATPTTAPTVRRLPLAITATVQLP